MYLTTVGGSMLLHVLAGHPRLVAALGIAGAVLLLSSPLGPGAHLGTEGNATRLERALPPAAETVSDRKDVEAAVDRLIATHDPRVPAMVASALNKCGANCSDLGIQQVMQDPVLEREVLALYAWDQLAANTAPAPPSSRGKATGSHAPGRIPD